MWITRLHQFLTEPTPHKSSPRTLFWFTLSLLFAALYGILALHQAFSSQYVVQDDARQHVFWMRRFLDESLFPKDLIANYFQSVAPLGYQTLYQFMAIVGIEPVVFSKILPLFLGLVMTGYCFAVSMELLPIPLTGFISSLLLNQNLWMQDGLISGTPKAFIYPILLAFFYYLLRQSLVGVGIAIALLGLFYPSLVLVCAALLILQLWQFNRKLPYLTQNRRDYIFCLTSLTVAFCVLLPYTLSVSEFSPVITAAQAKTLPDFLPQGRTSFFVDDAWAFWFNGRSGIRIDTALAPPLAYSGLLLPILLRFPARFPLTQQITRGMGLLLKLLLASGILFFAAHALLFKLHLPSRYTQHSFRIAIALSAGITLTLLLDAIFLGAQSTKRRQILALGSTAVIGITLLGYPHLALNTFPWTYYTVGSVPSLYEFFQQQPKDILIASLAEEANNLPTFAQRSILVSREYAVPYHWGYYRQFRQRTLDLINAQYSSDPEVVHNFIEKYGIDFWLLPATPFTPNSITHDNWLMQYQPAANEAIAQLEAGKTPALKPLVASCSVLETQDLVVLKADCTLKMLNSIAETGKMPVLRESDEY